MLSSRKKYNSKLFVNCDFPKNVYGDTVTVGQRCLEVRVPSEYLEPVEVGDIVIISFDDKGKFESLDRLTPALSVKPSSGSTDNSKDKK